MMKKPYSSDEVEDTKYAGAWVMPPIPGYYKYISCYDFKSMYPNIAMQYNTSPDSYLGKRGMIKEDGTEIITKNNTLFSSKFDSVTRVILERLYNARIEAQAEISDLKYN